MVVMRFAKVFLLLFLFGWGVFNVRCVAEHYRDKKAAVMAFGSEEKLRAFTEKFKAAENGGHETHQQLNELTQEFSDKITPIYWTINYSELGGYLVLLLVSTTAYLRFTPRRT
jgi:hypothetical protein